MEGAGYDDLPRNGAYVVGALADAELPLSRIIEHLGVSKQAAGQLVDTLVLRGYLERSVDHDDRRRLKVALTTRGKAAAEVSKRAISRVDAALSARVGAEDLARTRATLVVVIEAGASLAEP
jgi:DNA-binding MarR family transcriptional regulator